MLTPSQPPWHLWGGSQIIMTRVVAAVVGPIQLASNQLVKVSYGRPETWNWLLMARLIDGPQAPGFTTRLEVYFDLTVGHGRTMVQTSDPNTSPSSAILDIDTFEEYAFEWQASAPKNRRIYTTEVLAPNRIFRNFAPFTNDTGNAVPPEESASKISQLVAQEIQLQARIFAISPAPGSPTVGGLVTVEVSAFFAPQSHVRPDWFLLEKQLSEQFPGGEIGGR